MESILEDCHTAPIDDKLRAILRFLEKLTLNPVEIGPLDVKPVLEAGVSSQAIEDAIYICAFFNIIDRIADALDFRIPTAADVAEDAKHLLKRGYVQIP